MRNMIEIKDFYFNEAEALNKYAIKPCYIKVKPNNF